MSNIAELNEVKGQVDKMAALFALMATATLLCLSIEMTSGRPGEYDSL